MRTTVRISSAGWALVPLVAAWAAVHLVVATVITDSVFDGHLLGTDSYMRLVRVDELARGGGWFDHTIARSNAPFGDELHWTRPFDLALLALALPAVPFLGFDAALLFAGAAISPLIHLAMLGAAVVAAVPLVGRARAPMAAIVLLVQPAVLSHTLAGPADHHSLQLLLLVLEIGLLTRVLADPRRNTAAVFAGLIAGFGIWISAEMTILAGAAAAMLVAGWILAPEARVGALTRFGAGLFAIVLSAIVIERPPSDWLAVEYDKVSVAHLTAGIAILVVAGVLWFGARRATTLRGRTVVAATAALLAGAPLLLAFGGLLVGPGADVNPAIEPIWLDRVSELQPLFPSDAESFGRFLLYLGPTLVVLPVALIATWRLRDSGAGMLGWASVTALLALYAVLALLHLRFGSFAGVLIAIVSAQVLGQLRDWIREVPASVWRRAAWGGATLGLSVGFTLGGGVVAAASSEAEPATHFGCPRPAYEALDAVAGPSDVTFAHINLGPEILYRTDAAVVAGPYHRNDDGILDLHAFLAATDSEVSRQVAAERGGRFVLVCQIGNGETPYDGVAPELSLHDRLLTDDAPPSWLRLIDSAEGEASIRLYEMDVQP